MKTIANTLIFLFLTMPLLANEDHPLMLISWGELIEVDARDRDKFPARFYFSTKKGEKTYYYPVGVNKRFGVKDLKKFLGKQIKIEGEVREKKVMIGEFQKKLPHVDPYEIQALSMKDLAASSKVISNSITPKRRTELRRGGSRVSDGLTNAIIYTSAALLMGKILLDKK